MRPQPEGSTWAHRSMGDADGPIIARVVYQQLFRNHEGVMDTDSVPYALDEAIHAMRMQGLHAARWAPYIHLGI